jgi:hypothetical protein
MPAAMSIGTNSISGGEAGAPASRRVIKTEASGPSSEQFLREISRPERLDPEFVDCKGLEAGWGIKRSLAYALLADGKIQGVSLRRRNQVRGKRLFQVDSVRAFLRSQMERGR